MQKGTIGVTTENIFPIIKKFLYSEHDIFLRELISNAVDATQKVKALSSLGEYKGELGDLTIRVEVDEDKKTLTISDRGVGMTADEVNRYINQIAFSGAEEFLEKYKNQANIIGHFGLGFYSAFMVARQVDVVTRSYQPDAPAVKWSCDGSPEFTMEETDKAERGTDIILYLDDESTEFASKSKIEELLRKYCRFLPIPIAFGKEQEWKDGKYEDTDRDKIINDTNPLWTRKPAELKEEDYLQFYQELYPMAKDPLFHIHLNVDYPFNLEGVLYFPKVNHNFELQRNKIQLYSNQVFVTDSVEGIVPEFLTLLHGVIDSPDIPLNVSRSYLQGDPNVRRISSHITKKVADRLSEIFKNDREQFQQKWDDLKIFIQYGIVTDEKFAERATDFVLLKNTEGGYFTLEEYKEKVNENQTDKDGNLIYLYSNDPVAQDSFIRTAKSKGYDVLVMDSPLDTHFIGWFESKNDKIKLVRVDADVIDKLIAKDTHRTMTLSSEQQQVLRPVFESQLPTDEKIHYNVVFEALSEDDAPVIITQNEFMRRMKDMSAMGGSPYAFYGQMPDSYNIVVNGNNGLIINVLEQAEAAAGDDLKKWTSRLEKLAKEKKSFEEVVKDKKEEELSQEEKDFSAEIDKKMENSRNEMDTKLKEIGSENKLVKQLIDLALLSNGMLKGENLTNFITRSVELIGK